MHKLQNSVYVVYSPSDVEAAINEHMTIAGKYTPSEDYLKLQASQRGPIDFPAVVVLGFHYSGDLSITTMRTAGPVTITISR